jgi:hypothetical protein
MALCGGSVDCSDKCTSLTIKILPDIVGVGVGIQLSLKCSRRSELASIITSFLATSIIAFVLVLLGYSRDSLPGEYLT